MHARLPAWLRPAANSQVAARLAQGQSPWMDCVHLLWSAWVFVVPVFSSRGYDSTWLLCTVVSYPLFLLLYARMLLAPRDTLYRHAWAMGALSAALLPVYPSGISYFVFACMSLRPSTRHALWRHFAMLVLMNALYLGWAHWLGTRLQSLVWLPVSVLGMAAVGAVYSINERKDEFLRLSQDEVQGWRPRPNASALAAICTTCSAIPCRWWRSNPILPHAWSNATRRRHATKSTPWRRSRVMRWRWYAARSPASAPLAWWPNWHRRGCFWTWTASRWNSNWRHCRCRPNTKPRLRWWCAKRPPMCSATPRQHVCVQLRAHGEQAVLEITDDGRGGVIVPGNGLDGMRARLHGLGGALEVEALPRGMRLRASVPVPRTAPATSPLPMPAVPQSR